MALNVGLWVIQGLLFLVFTGTAVWKVVTPLPELAAMIPWAGQVPVAFFYFTAAADLAGGLGILLPSLTRIQPRLTVWAALGCALLQASAVVFHLSRGESANTPFNFLLVALSVFVFWGRRRAPVQPRA
ncbi:MAG TPA: DoxX family protein [Polyangiaceae bacterium]